MQGMFSWREAAGLSVPDSHSGVDRLSSEKGGPILAEHKERRAYVQSMRTGENKFVRRARYRVSRDVPVADVRAVVGQRWEVEFDLGTEGATPHATKLQPKPDDGGEDEIELKGKPLEVTADSFVLCGVRVAMGESTEFYGAFEGVADERAKLATIHGVKVILAILWRSLDACKPIKSSISSLSFSARICLRLYCLNSNP